MKSHLEAHDRAHVFQKRFPNRCAKCLTLRSFIPPETGLTESGADPRSPDSTRAAGLETPNSTGYSWGIGTGVVADGKSPSGGTFLSPAVPYVRMNYRSTWTGASVAFAPGPRLNDPGIWYGAALKPVQQLPRMTLLVGARSGSLGRGLGDGTRFAIGVAFEIDRLILRGCEKH